MRALFADNLPPACLEGARTAGFECSVEAGLGADDLAGAISGFDVLVVRSTPVDAAAIEAADNLGLIVRAGAGTNTIDIGAAASAAIQVANVPGKNAIAVAELTMGLMLAIDRRIADGVMDSRSGRWDKKGYSAGRGLFGRSLGVVGLGAIGMAVAERARAFGMQILVIARPDRDPDRAERLETMLATEVATVQELVASSDVITFHVPAAIETKGALDADLLKHARPGTIVLNTSRGDTMNEDGLLEVIEERELWLGLDVYPDEPDVGRGGFESPIARHPRVYGTHHIGASTAQAQEAVAAGVVEILAAYAAGEDIATTVNLAPAGSADATLVVRHRNRVGVLSDVLGILRRAGLNVEDMANRVFEGGEAALATIHLRGELTVEIRQQVAAAKNVIAVSSAP